MVPPEGNRQQIPLDAVPVEVQNAVLAAEDRDFWDNSGFSFSGFARAALGQITGNPGAGGGSTLGDLGALPAGYLSAGQARIALATALATGVNPRSLL